MKDRRDNPNNPPGRDQALRRFKDEAYPFLPDLLRVAHILTGDVHRAEDLVQEAMLRAVRHIETYQPGTHMKAWLMTILRRAHIDLYRKDQRRPDADSLDALQHDPKAPATEEADPAWERPDELLERIDDPTLIRALQSLPDPMRWVLLLVDVEQMAVNEAAAALDVPPGTVKSRASRARAMLRQRLLPIAKEKGWVTHSAGN
ncbi:MAG: sigma-70 family RNA polymerase sigma factor [Phycisphaeraceae bacterium]